MGNIYYHPEQFGMTLIGEVDRGSGYDFDMVAVWKLHDGTLVWEQDSGCSCPSPFENLLPSDLKPIDTLEPYLRGWAGESGLSNDDVALLEKVWKHS